MISLIDGHTAPQFWFLCRIAKQIDLTFKLLPLDQINIILPQIERLNITKLPIDIPLESMEQINFFMTEDIVLYNNFLNTSTSLTKLVDRIKLEKEFISTVQEYRNFLTMYL